MQVHIAPPLALILVVIGAVAGRFFNKVGAVVTSIVTTCLIFFLIFIVSNLPSDIPTKQIEAIAYLPILINVIAPTFVLTLLGGLLGVYFKHRLKIK